MIIFLIPFLDLKNTSWHGNSFMLDQIYDQLINPHMTLGFCLIVWISFMVLLYLKRQSLRYGYCKEND